MIADRPAGVGVAFSTPGPHGMAAAEQYRTIWWQVDPRVPEREAAGR